MINEVSIENRKIGIEVIKEKSSTFKTELFENNVKVFLKEMGSCNAPVTFDKSYFENDPFMYSNVISVKVIYCDDGVESGQVNFNKMMLDIFIYQLNEQDDAGEEELEHDNESVVAADNWVLPLNSFEGLWESLVFESRIKSQLLNYAYSALLFGDRKVSPSLISWNKLILLHGPPGTGKTSLCRALAHKLSIRLSSRFPESRLMEISSHGLFSRWFSESGKLVMRLMRRVLDHLVEKPNALLFLLVDEIESLAAARTAALSGNEPSDSIRVVNSLLTQLDKVKNHENVIILTTSNITEAVDSAFLDRVDVRLFVGNPGPSVTYGILKTCLDELMSRGIIYPSQQLISHRALDCMQFTDNNVGHGLLMVSKCSLELWRIALQCGDFSGRTLRKLCFLAHARYVRWHKSMKTSSNLNNLAANGSDFSCDISKFLHALERQVDDMVLEYKRKNVSEESKKSNTMDIDTPLNGHAEV